MLPRVKITCVYGCVFLFTSLPFCNVFMFLKQYCFGSRIEKITLEIPSNERSLIQARYRSLQRAADQPLFPHYDEIKRARI